VKGDFESAAGSFAEDVKKAAPAAKLKEVWDGLTAQVGSYQHQIGTFTTQVQDYQMVTVTCQFEKDAIDILVSLDQQGLVRGFTFKQARISPAPAQDEIPLYVQAGSFKEIAVQIGSGKWTLPGTLTLPVGPGPFPGVVLVHGSGPNDRDETIGSNKPFRDLAWGLASRGIAVLRYDKRTLVHASQFTPEVLASFTAQEEVIADALLAVELFRHSTGVDPASIYLIGHSEGGMLAPRIAQQDPSLAGLVILAAPSRPLEDLMLEQTNYLYSLDGVLSEEEKAGLDAVKTDVARIKDPGLSSAGSSQA
jgi:pimeloyl-ACP methyl ester carboxylesterase